MKDAVETVVANTFTRENLTVGERDDAVLVTGYWDDLDPEPRRTDTKDDLKTVRRALVDEGFEVSELETQYGAARLWVRAGE